MICGSCDDDELMLLCDGCDKACHLGCAGYKRAPRGDWFCVECKPTKRGLDAQKLYGCSKGCSEGKSGAAKKGKSGAAKKGKENAAPAAKRSTRSRR